MTQNLKNLHQLKKMLGTETFYSVANAFSGQRVTFPKRLDTLDKEGRNQAIKDEYNLGKGLTVSELSKKYELEQSQIYKIIEKTP